MNEKEQKEFKLEPIDEKRKGQWHNSYRTLGYRITHAPTGISKEILWENYPYPDRYGVRKQELLFKEMKKMKEEINKQK